MVISNSARSEGRMGKYSGLDCVNIYAHSDTGPVLLLFGHGEDFQGISWKVQGGAAPIAFASPRAALLIPVPEPPSSLEPETHLKSILDSTIAQFLRDYQPDYWPIRGPQFHVVVSSRSRSLPRDVYWPMLKQLLQTHNLPANETLTLQDFKTPDVPDDLDINFIVHEKQGHSHVTLLDETDGPPPWFYIGVDDLEDRTARFANRQGSSNYRSSVFRMLRDETPPKLPAAAPKQTSASKGRGNAKLVLPEDSLMDWCKTFAAKAKGKSPPKSFSNHWDKTSDEIPTPESPFHWAESKSFAPVSPSSPVSKGKVKAKEVRWQPLGRTQAVPQKTWPPEDNDKDEETQHLEAWQDWWKETGHELPEGGRRFHCRPSGVESALSFYEKLSALRVHGEGGQDAAASAGPQASPAVDKGKGKGKEAQRLPLSQPTPFVSQEASTPQGKDQGLPPLWNLGLLPGDSLRPRPPTIGQPTWGDNIQGFPRVPPPVALLPPLLGENAQGLTRLAPLGLPNSQANRQGLPSATYRGEGFRGGSFSVTPQTSTSENKDRGGQRESSSATSQARSSRGKRKEDSCAPN